MDALGWLLLAAALQLGITGVAVAVDIGVVFKGFWVPLMRETRPEDRPFLFKGIASWARGAREAAEFEARIREQQKNARR